MCCVFSLYKDDEKKHSTQLSMKSFPDYILVLLYVSN